MRNSAVRATFARRPCTFAALALPFVAAACGGGQSGGMGDAVDVGTHESGPVDGAVDGANDAVDGANNGDASLGQDVPDVRDVWNGDDADVGTQQYPPVDEWGGSVDRLHFAVFGDVRPPLPDEVWSYPTDIITQVMQGIQSEDVQFVVGTGDYMNENLCSACAGAQLDQLQMAETNFTGHIFHAMGNHECLTISDGNCPNQNETVALRTYKMRLIPDYTNVYFDWTIHTRSGNAHFIATAPNAWTAEQRSWLYSMLAIPARYTFVIAHEPPTKGGPGTTDIETAIMARPGGVTMRLYGHVHDYEHVLTNAIITGNAGAPLENNYQTYGFATLEQRDDDNIVVNVYAVGTPPTVVDSFVVTPDGMATF